MEGVLRERLFERWEEGWGNDKKGEGIKKYTLVVTEQSQRCEV